MSTISETTEKKQRKKPPHLFRPGQSGNPAGRPKGTRNVETLFRDAIEKIATDQKVQDVERELVITLLAKAKKGDLKAMEMYLDRLYGKPKQYIDMRERIDSSLTAEQEKELDNILKIG